MPTPDICAGNPDSSIKILLDTPTRSPALGYEEIGRALATIIVQSEARFTVGVFGGWGSGKTTLMTAIKEALPGDTVVAVDFNAWRFEREPQLLAPLLDVIREALVSWSSERDADTKERVRTISARVGHVIRVLATGLSGQVGIPGAATIKFDAGKVATALSSIEEPDRPQSFYLAAFRELERAFSAFSCNGIDRVVVFVDDLDRCLPSNALDILESIKLFFDLPGFVFVIGIDEDAVERAISAKFANQKPSSAVSGGDASPAMNAWNVQRLGREYIKKIFQVPYTLPAMVPEQLDDLLISMYDDAALSSPQRTDLEQRLRPYIGYVAIERRINPREVKRFINAYTLQMLVRPHLDRETVLALQTLAFRAGWEELYDAILRDSALFIDALGRYRDGEETAFEELSPHLQTIPWDLRRYLKSSSAEPLTRHSSLDIYLSSLKATSGPQLWFHEAFRLIGQIRRSIQRTRDNRTATSEELRHLAGNTAKVLHTIKSLYDASVPHEADDRLSLAIRQTSMDAMQICDDRVALALGTSLDKLENAIQGVISEMRLVRDSSPFGALRAILR